MPKKSLTFVTNLGGGRLEIRSILALSTWTLLRDDMPSTMRASSSWTYIFANWVSKSHVVRELALNVIGTDQMCAQSWKKKSFMKTSRNCSTILEFEILLVHYTTLRDSSIHKVRGHLNIVFHDVALNLASFRSHYTLCWPFIPKVQDNVIGPI